jgi:hypothetical protein
MVKEGGFLQEVEGEGVSCGELTGGGGGGGGTACSLLT